jgi:D-alanyl-D-alanine carboxypeptidase/D-alanyl-D-alanine-endopeptidase (penicillin-binding protein 4)
LDKKPTDNKVKGPLYLKGGGDPSFVSENMWFLVNAFMRTGVEVIDGDIIVDDSLFDAVRFDESREDNRVDRAYDAPVGAMSFNWNSINIFVRPGKKGEKAQVFLDPESEYVKLENHAKTSDGSKINIDVSRKKAGDQDVIVVNGSIGDDVREHVVFKNITRPDLWSGYQLKSFLAQRGIKVKGEVKHGNAPENGYLAAESESKPIEHVLADMNKFSNNYVAEMLTKNLGLKKSRPGTIAGGMYVIQDHLKELGISKEEAEIYNPSGLTRDNQITPKAMWKVLDHLRDDFRVQPEFLSSLPIAGIDGTLKKRMKGSEAERWVRAKTGLLTGVVALAGYLGRKDGSVLTFVMIYNGNQDEAKVRQFYDDLLIGLVD